MLYLNLAVVVIMTTDTAYNNLRDVVIVVFRVDNVAEYIR